MKNKKDLAYYLSLPYTVKLIPELEDGGYMVMIEELPGCLSQGDTYEEALEMIEDAKKGWLEVSLEDGLLIPEPKVMNEDYSGKFLVRMSKDLHKTLSLNAQQANSSLNQFVVDVLARNLYR